MNSPNKPELSNDDITRKLLELDELTKKVNKIIELSDVGDSIRDEFLADNYKALNDKGDGVEIPHLTKKYKETLFPKRDRTPTIAINLLESEIVEALDKAPSALKAAERCGVSYPTFRKYAVLYGVFRTPGYPVLKGGSAIKRGPISPYAGKFPLNEILENKHPGFPAHRLKDKLIRSGLKKCECEQCGYSERRVTDGKIPLLVNFDDGDNNNFLIENLKVMCYNCTFTSGRGYISRGSKSFDPDILQDSKKVLTQRF
jgi:hypothetical protein